MILRHASKIGCRTSFQSFAVHPTGPGAGAASLASREDAVMAEHLVGMAWRNADGRTAHFLLELAARLRLVGMSDKKGYA